MKTSLQRLIRRAHLLACNRGLPDRIAILLHDLEPESWPAFRQLVSYFREREFRFTGPDGFIRPGADRRVFVSFDDNYRCWHDALGVMDELAVRVTFYVNARPCRDVASADVIAEYYDRLHFTGTRTPLAVSEVEDLAAAGHTVGNHTYSHFVLTSLGDAEAREEIRMGKETLEAMLGRAVRHFSWPYGMRRHFSDGLRRYCDDLGGSTVASAIAGLQHGADGAREIHRTVWHLDRPLAYNVANLCVDGRYWERVTGRNAVI